MKLFMLNTHDMTMYLMSNTYSKIVQSSTDNDSDSRQLAHRENILHSCGSRYGITVDESNET